MKPELDHEEMDGQTYWFVGVSSQTPDPSPKAYLLSIYDELISGYRDRSAIVEAEHGARLVAMGNALTAVILLDGRIVGTWKRLLRKDSVVIATDLFVSLTTAESHAVLAAAQRYGDFLGLRTQMAA